MLLKGNWCNLQTLLLILTQTILKRNIISQYSKPFNMTVGGRKEKVIVLKYVRLWKS